MTEFLYAIDRTILLFINQTLGSATGDFLWPLVTHYTDFLPVRILLAGIWLLLLFRGGKNGRVVALLLIPLLAASDQLSSSLLKELFARPRPCHSGDAGMIVEGLRLLVDCGPGKSFPSSHAVNNFAVAFLFAHYYHRYRWYFFVWAGLVALSRPAVGVHYPSDIFAGALIGLGIGWSVVRCWEWIDHRYFSQEAQVNEEANA